MEKLSTIQKLNNLNSVYRCGSVGPGEAYHDYSISLVGAINTAGAQYYPIQIHFQRGARKDPAARHGILDNDLLEIVRDRLAAFQAGDYPCHENDMALMHIEEALMWMNRRTEDRAERQVLGTYNK